ncbi:hypothetical protein [Desulfurivibrio dismutans]|uniref:hypothetical protein n=1 Tax=Desulfurivibrio dismutans TaxID=1398908 RepID=UPI0023DA84A1|nr:hypothetical protein [Desulfurivibrio alkaliphilus]MDF1614343.1 hypothetical protein [Desulfurivibrio alkaliphilus]
MVTRYYEFFISVVILSLLLIIVSPLKSNAYYAGKNWTTWSAGSKFLYISGYYDGMKNGASMMHYQMSKECANEKKKFHIETPGGNYDVFQKFPPDYSIQFSKNNIDIYDINQIVAGVDACFSNFKNMHLSVQQCVGFAERGINGTSQKEIEEYLEMCRSLNTGSN